MPNRIGDSNVMTGKRFILACFVFGGIAACEQAVDMPGDPERGREYGERNCGSCHATGQTGESPYPPAPPFRTLSQLYPIENLAEALAEGIGVGHAGEVQMPEFILTTEEIDDLLAYLSTLEN